MGRSIVVVEDEAVLRWLIVRNLEARGHTVRHARTAAEAADALLGQPPDMVLLDIDLPDCSGWDVLRELRRRGADAPTVVLSASRVTPTLLEEFRPLGYLPKPFMLEALLEFVRGESRPVVGRAAAARPRRRM